MYYCCKGLGDGCANSCSTFQTGFKTFCEGLSKIFSRPFSLCTFLTALFVALPAIGAIVVVIIDQSNLKYNCKNNILMFVGVFAACLILNTLYTFYLYHKFSNMNEDDIPEDQRHNQRFGGGGGSNYPANENGQPLTAGQKFTYFLCYDFVTLGFIILLGFEIVWAIVGSTWLSGENRGCSEQKGFSAA